MAKKKTGRPPKNRPTQVMRVSKEVYDRLKDIKGKGTYDEAFDKVFAAFERMQSSGLTYEIHGRLLRGFNEAQLEQVAQCMGVDGEDINVFVELGKYHEQA